MRRAGLIVHQILERLRQMVQPGITTLDLEAEAERMMKEAGAK
ncbi:MAG: M24 family metallopeptidase, partial [Bryobacteraceae bacterium]